MAPEHGVDALVAGRYRMLGELGRGGMGVVWRAEDTLLQRTVAVKGVEFPMALTADERERLRARVLREARAAARLNHPGAVTLYDVVEEGARLFIVMEWVNAPTLAEVVASEGSLPAHQAARIGLDVLGALQAAHSEGIVHRDVKPANVMVPAAGPARLADFGIASIKGDPQLTTSGALIGSPSYMAPEQAEEKSAGPAADLWALGATLYFAVEGHPPFERGHAIATLTAIVHEEPAPAPQAGSLGPVIAALLAKDPAARPSEDRLRAMLEEALASGDGALPVSDQEYEEDEERDPEETQTMAVEEATRQAEVVPPAPAEPPPPAPPPTAEPEPAPPPRRAQAPAAPRPAVAGDRRWLLVPLAALVVGAVLLVLLAGRDRSRPGPEPASGRASTTRPAPGGETQTASDGGRVPPSWARYRDPSTGYSIAHPPGWRIERRGTITDFRDPRSGTYLRVDWTDRPGPSPQAAWEEYEPRFAAQNQDYRRIRMTPTTFKGFPASDWEFTYSARGARLHAVDLGMVAGRYGFALNFQSREEDWVSSQPLFEGFKASFVPPS